MIEGGDVVEIVVRNVDPPSAIHSDARGPYELPFALPRGAKGAEVLAVGVEHRDPDAPSKGGLGTTHGVDAPVPGDGGVHGVVEPLALHRGHAQGEVVLQEALPRRRAGHQTPPYSR